MERLQDLKTKTKILTGSGILLAFILLLGSVSYININSIVATNKQVNHTHIVLSEAEGIIGSAVDMETGMRGYLLAGKTDFLAPYNSGKVSTYQKIEELKHTVSDNPKQVKRLEEIETVLKTWQAKVTEPTIALRTEIGNANTMNDISRLVGEAKGKVYFDKFRGQISEFIAREQTLLTARSRKVTPNNAISSIKWVTHTYDVIITANNILAAAVDMETGMRGYLLSGKEDFLAPYTAGKTTFFKLTNELKQTVNDNPKQVLLLNQIEENIQEWIINITEPTIIMRREIGNSKTMQDMAQLVGQAKGKVYFDQFRSLISDFKAEESSLMKQRRLSNESAVSTTLILVVVLVISAFIIGMTIAWIVAKGVASPLVHMTSIMQSLAQGNLQVHIPGQKRKDEIGDMAKAVVVFKDAAVEKVKSDKATKKLADLASALRVCQANVMLADTNSSVVYANDQLYKLMNQRQSELQHKLSRFSVDSIIGMSVGDFHQSLSSLQHHLKSNGTEFQTEIVIGTLTFAITASPWITADGERLGIVVEWEDRTAEVSIEQEVANVVQTATRGDFSQRIDLKGKTGFFHDVSVGINTLTHVVQNVADDLANNLQALSKGDLTSRITTEYEGIFLQLKDDYNVTSEKLAQVVGIIKSVSEEVNTSSNEMAVNSKGLAERASSQAATLEQTSAAMEELSSTVRTNAQQAKDVSSASLETRNIASQGKDVVNEAGEAMIKIKESSQKVTEIITVIDEIAFQTNLLALNANVEAARAGEAGRGFAVVAQEVRNLAQRSAQSAKDIKCLIEDSSQQVNDGVNLVNSTAVSLQSIYDSIDDVTSVINQISKASNEQTTGLDEMRIAILNMDKLTQENATMAEVGNNASQSLQDKATGLGDTVEFFKLEEDSPSFKKRNHGKPKNSTILS